jgi:hypothetical protein
MSGLLGRLGAAFVAPEPRTAEGGAREAVAPPAIGVLARARVAWLAGCAAGLALPGPAAVVAA